MRRRARASAALLGAVLLAAGAGAAAECLVRGTGDLGLVVERASGSVQVLDTTARRALYRIEGLGDLSHASAVFSRDGRYAYVFGRDGGLTKLDLLCARIAQRVVQAGNSIGGAISQDGRLVAVSNYDPGGVKVFDAGSLALVADVPASYGDGGGDGGGDGARSKVVGLVDAPGGRFVYSLYDAGQIAVLEVDAAGAVRERRFEDVGRQPYDGLITPDGRFYAAGLFGEDGVALLDLWETKAGVRRILGGYGRGERKLPVYKMPHLEGWAVAGDHLFLPAVGLHQLLVVERRTWGEAARVEVAGQPVFAVARPDGREVWVNFALPHNDTIEIVDVRARRVVDRLQPGRGALHMEFAPRGETVWISVRDADAVHVYDTASRALLARIPAAKPSGIFFTARAHRIGL